MAKVIAAAVKTDDGVIHFLPQPHRHHHILHAVYCESSNKGLAIDGWEQGFVMSDGTFAGRIEAAKAAIKAGQIVALQHPPKLYSEDLW